MTEFTVAGRDLIVLGAGRLSS